MPDATKNPLDAPLTGECVKCKGVLCLRGDVVACSVCGTPQEEHPMTLAIQAYKPVERKTREVAPEDFAPTWERQKELDLMARTKKLEEAVRTLQEMVRQQGERLARLEKTQVSGSGKRTG